MLYLLGQFVFLGVVWLWYKDKAGAFLPILASLLLVGLMQDTSVVYGLLGFIPLLASMTLAVRKVWFGIYKPMLDIRRGHEKTHQSHTLGE